MPSRSNPYGPRINFDVATVSLAVTPVNDDPVANNDDFTSTPVNEGDTIAGLNVLANDTDDGTLDVTTVTITGQTNGTATANPVTGLVDFTHDGSETTVASFTYTVNDAGKLTTLRGYWELEQARVEKAS